MFCLSCSYAVGTIYHTHKTKININIMNDDYLNYGNPCEEDDREYECTECGNPVSEDGDYCSAKCWEAGQM